MAWAEHKPRVHGAKSGHSTLEVRCRRKDLPVAHLTPFADQFAAKVAAVRAAKEQPATKRVPVRMWADAAMTDPREDSSELWDTHASIGTPTDNTEWCEILHDADGFYVETEVTE